jgi:4-hydroxy-tetrahydrodipicolinate synthase
VFEGVVDFYKRVVEEVGDSDLKYILYNIPQVSGVSIGLEVIEQLIKYFPNNVVGMKESSGNLDNMLRITKYFNNFSLFSGSDSLALKVCQRGGAGAITACSNISGKLLNYIINNYKKETEIKNFQLLQQLQEQIRKTLLLHEPISALKAFLSVTNNNENWNKVNPPLIKILHPKDHKTVMSLIELIKKMDELFSFTH